ncbi:uncharacterized protein LOC121870277 [Homarus americanus]|uniref:uncharacterized protein LOC121870277 n=1 Tax=Homarus americanus TaxID=6706 RepID=UPI001C48660D|nr:uncharacterized protein LOC121870277 [Homarus americanus]
MEIPTKNKSGESTGVSRSGRVRKKSSKLADFESPDEIDTRFKRKTDRPQKSPKVMKLGHPMGADIYDDSDSFMDDDVIDVKDEPLEVDDWGENEEVDDDMCDDGDDREDATDPLQVDDDSTDMPRESSNYSLAQSLYFSEKQGKKNIMLKDGQVVRRKKAQRKDKGKSRFTAYMLWAREIRPGIIQANPNMDFSAVNKRLGELWALVPTTQKYNWKRRAKRLAAKGNQKGSMISTGKAAKQSQNTVRSNLINKGGVKPQQVIRTTSKQPDVGQSAPAPTQKTHVATPKRVARIGSPRTRQKASDSLTKGEVSRNITEGFTVVSEGVKIEEEVEQVTTQSVLTAQDVHNMANVIKQSILNSEELKKGATLTLQAVLKAEHVENAAKLTTQCILKADGVNKTDNVTRHSTPTTEPVNDTCAMKTQSVDECNSLSDFHVTKTEILEGKVVYTVTRTVKSKNMKIIVSDSAKDCKGRPEVPARSTAADDVSANGGGNFGDDSEIVKANRGKTDIVPVKVTVLKGRPKADDAAKFTSPSVSKTGNGCTVKIVTEGPQGSKAAGMQKTIAAVFKDIGRYHECCPEMLESAIRATLLRKVAQSLASEIFCIYVGRLSRCLRLMPLLTNATKDKTYQRTLTRFSSMTDADRFFEWMLRMRQMGRLPVERDKHLVAFYLGMDKVPQGLRTFLLRYGEQSVDYQDWCYMTRPAINNWKLRLSRHLNLHHGVSPEELLSEGNSHRIFSCVELSLSLARVATEVYVQRGYKNTYSFAGLSDEGTCTMVTFSAAGLFLKPLVLRAGYSMPPWSRSGLVDETLFHSGASADGQLDPLVFLSWLKLFNAEIEENKIKKPVLLLVHGHPCHASPAAATYCRREGIILFSHYHWPLNLMDPFLRMSSKFHYHYEASVRKFQDSVGDKPLKKKHFPAVLLDALSLLKEQKEVAVSAFFASGLVPFNMACIKSNLHTSCLTSAYTDLMPYPVKLCRTRSWYGSDGVSGKTFEPAPQIHLPYWCDLSLPHTLQKMLQGLPSPKDVLRLEDPLLVRHEPLLSDATHKDVVHVYQRSGGGGWGGDGHIREDPVLETDDGVFVTCDDLLYAFSRDAETDDAGASGDSWSTGPGGDAATCQESLLGDRGRRGEIDDRDATPGEFRGVRYLAENNDADSAASETFKIPCVYIKCENHGDPLPTGEPRAARSGDRDTEL